MTHRDPRAIIRRVAFTLIAAATMGITPVHAELLATGGSRYADRNSGYYDYEDNAPHYRSDHRRYGNAGDRGHGAFDRRRNADRDDYRSDRRRDSSVGDAGLAEQRRIEDANRRRGDYGYGRDRRQSYGYESGRRRSLYGDNTGRDRRSLYGNNVGADRGPSYRHESGQRGSLYGDNAGRSNRYSSTPRNRPGYHSGGGYQNYGQQNHGYSGRQRAPSVPPALRRYR